jgi:hypothetical protein
MVVTVKMTIFWDCDNMLSAKNLAVIKRNLIPESAGVEERSRNKKFIHKHC